MLSVLEDNGRDLPGGTWPWALKTPASLGFRSKQAGVNATPSTQTGGAAQSHLESGRVLVIVNALSIWKK